MLVSGAVPLLVLWYGRIQKRGSTCRLSRRRLWDFSGVCFLSKSATFTLSGGNIWVALRDGFGIMVSRKENVVRANYGNGCYDHWAVEVFPAADTRDVCIAGSVSMLVYLVTSEWTTYAYFTFLVPLIALSVVSKGGEYA